MDGMVQSKDHTRGATILYDGDCPFCSAFVRMARLGDAAGDVTLVNARDPHPLVDRARAEGLDLDRGMVVEMDGVLHHGDRAMTLLAAMTTRSGTFNRMVRLAFASPARARVLYPPLVAGRNLTLRLLGRKPIAEG